MKIESLLQYPESKTLEFKRDLSSLPKVLKTIVAFANTAGGTLIIGREDNGDLLGLDEVLDSEERLANAIADNIRPQLLAEIEVASVQGKDLLVVKVSHSRGPYYIKKEGECDGVYVRLGSTNRQASPEMLGELTRSLSTTYDQNIIDSASVDDLDGELLKANVQRMGKAPTAEVLQTLGIVAKRGGLLFPTIGGMILYGRPEARQSFVPDARVSCARFQGTDKARILDRIEIEGSILEAVNEVPLFIARNTRLAADIKGMYRHDTPEYHRGAVREALINALAHADYSIRGSHTRIAIYSDRLEIENPGMLPFGFTLDDFKSGISRIRNRVIARTFSNLMLMEEWGSGYQRIMNYCQEEGYPDPLWEESGTAMRVTFYPHPATQEVQPTSSLTARQQEIMSFLHKRGESSFREIMDALSVNVSERTLHAEIASLNRIGFIQRTGHGRSARWSPKTRKSVT